MVHYRNLIPLLTFCWKRRRRRKGIQNATHLFRRDAIDFREGKGIQQQDFSLILPSWNRGLVSSFAREFVVADLTRVFAVFQTLHAYGSSGCLGRYKKTTLVATVAVPPKGSTKQGKAVKKPSTSEDFWTTSTHDMDNSAVQSQASISSTSVTNLAADPHGVSCNPTEFVNHGLILWNQNRQRWIGNKKSENRTEQLREPKLSWNATYESLLGSNKPLPQPIPLAEMVDFLVDIWEQEGLYD